MTTSRRVEPALSPALFRALKRAVVALGAERFRQTYQTTFWFDFGAPECLPEAAALELRRHLPKGARVQGVEWWLSRMWNTDVQVDFHLDRDERLVAATGKVRHPVFSSVLFLNRVKGGLLALTDEPFNPDNPAQAPDRLELDFVAPRPNRFVAFPGTTTHGVLDRDHGLPTHRLSGPRQLRLAAIFNWWDRRPLEVPRWSETGLYRRLG